MRDWKDFLKKHFKQVIALLLAIAIVISYSLSRSSDRTLRAGGFPADDQIELDTDTGFGEDSPESGATEAAPVELVLDELQETGEEVPEESAAESAMNQEEPEQEAAAQEGAGPEESGSEKEPEVVLPDNSYSNDLITGEDSPKEKDSEGEELTVTGEEESQAESGGSPDVSSEEEEPSLVVSGSGEEIPLPEESPADFSDGDLAADAGDSLSDGEADKTEADDAEDDARREEGPDTAESSGGDEESSVIISTEEEENTGAEDDGGNADRSDAEDDGNADRSDAEDGDGNADRSGAEDGDGNADRSGAEEDAGNVEGSGAEDDSRETFFTTENEDSEQASAVSTGEKTGEGAAEHSGEKTSEDAGQGSSEAAADATIQEQTFFTMEEEASAGETTAAAEAGKEKDRPHGIADTLVFEGPDYKVTASYGADAGIPAGASLVVFEIKEGAKNYQDYCDQAQAAVAENLSEGSSVGQDNSSRTERSETGIEADTGTSSIEAEEEENHPSPAGQDAGETESDIAAAGQTDTASAAADTEVSVSWVRLFDITIEVDGVAVEPQGPVSVQIDYDQAIGQTADEEVSTVHFEGREEVPVLLETKTEGSGETLEQVTFETEGFSVFAIMGTTITKRILASDGVGYQVTLTCGPDAAVPADAELEVQEIPEDSEIYQACREKSEALFEADRQVAFARFFDIKILKDGREIQPAAPVEVRIELADKLQEDTKAVHFEQKAGKSSTQEADVQEADAVLLDASLVEADRMDSAVTFSAGSFSIYGIFYTVDFHWEANGKTYEYSLPGGGFISLSDVFEALEIGKPGRGSDEDAREESREDAREKNKEDAEEGKTKDGEKDHTEDDKEDNAGAGKRNASVRTLVENVESAVFSNPDLVWVGKVRDAATVGEVIDEEGLKVQYSSALTKKEIESINARTVQAGDWVLISLFPFTSEESLTVTMKNEDQFVIRVTDAQISTHVITADGEDFIITINYEDDAKIPEDAVLEAEEIVPGSGEYENYLTKTMAAIHEENPISAEGTSSGSGEENRASAGDTSSGTSEENPASAGDTSSGGSQEEAAAGGTSSGTGEEAPADTIGIRFARFFDLHIVAGGKTIEPAAPVEVTVAYADALNMEEEETLCAVHFAESGTEVLPASTDEEQKAVTFLQDSFSVTGTIVTSAGGWPASGSSSVMYAKSGNNYYAVAHDGSLHQVTVNGKKLTFPDAAEGFDIGQYLWTHEQQGSFGWTSHYIYYTDSRGGKHYLAPNTSGGIGSSAVSLSRDSSGRIYYNPGYGTSSYLGTDSKSLIGSQTSSKGADIQFASDFVLPRNVTIHFVDRDGNALTGISYTGPDSYPVTAKEDGTFTVPLQWDSGNTSSTLHLDTNFSKSGYTYASTHLAGTREGKKLTYDGLTMDAALTARGNDLYYYADAGQILAYGSLTERKLNDALQVPNAAGTGMVNYTASNTDKEIYVILDPVPSSAAAQTSEEPDIEDPEFSKSLENNEDGTYTLSLNVTGRGINASSNPKANVIFVVDTSSSMDKTEGTGTNYSRLHDTKPALKTLARDLLLSNSMTGKDPDTVEVSMVSFDGGVVDEIGWTRDYSAFANRVDKGLVLHRGTDWEDALDRAYTLGLDKQAAEPDQKVFVVFFTDGEGSQYRNFHGQGTYQNTVVNPNYNYWYSYFLCRESAKDEARAIVNAGMQFYAIYAFNKDEDKYKGEAGSDLLRNLVRHAYNSEELGNKNFFARASNTAELEAAFNSILLSVREFLGFSEVVLNDDITSLTSTGINLVSSAVGGFSYTRSGGQYGSGRVWEDAPEATHNDDEEGEAVSVHWDLGSIVLEEGVTYTVSFRVWPSQEAYDWLADLENGTRTWKDVVAAGLDAPDGENPQIVKNGDSYSLLTNKPSRDSQGRIINNRITYQKTHSETVTEEDIPAGTKIGKPIESRDEDGNRVTTTYTLDNGVYTRTVVTEKEACFKNPDPMPLLPELMKVMKKWETSMNTSHPADELRFRVLVDGQYYQKDGSLAGGETGRTNAEVLSVSEAVDWTDSIHIAPGIVKYYDDDGNALSEALVLETGHSYSLEEFDLKENGSDFLYYTSYEFHAQTIRPMIVDGTLQYLVLIDPYNPAPEDARTYTIGTQTYYAAPGGSGMGTLSGTNYRTAELDVTKILLNSSGADLTEEELDAETFTYRITLSIHYGTDPAGIVGYEYVPRIQDNAYTLFGYQEGETAFASDIERFSGKTFRAWNTLVYRDLVEWENIGGRIVSKTDSEGNILWKVDKDAEGYHSITYDMTLNRKEVIRFTNLPTGTRYSIREIYANYYPADSSEDSGGHAPVDLACNLAAEGYEIKQVLTTGGTVTGTEMENDTVSGTIDTPNVRYYNQFTNDRTSVTTQISILKTSEDNSKPLPGAVFDLYDREGYEAEPQTALQKGLISSDEAGKEGTIDLGRLKDGTYYLVETAAPEGYLILTEPVTITVERGTVHYSMENSTLDDSGNGISGDYQSGYQLRVINYGGYTLPSTGGPGTSPLLLFTTALGAVLVLLATVLLTREV